MNDYNMACKLCENRFEMQLQGVFKRLPSNHELFMGGELYKPLGPPLIAHR